MQRSLTAAVPSSLPHWISVGQELEAWKATLLPFARKVQNHCWCNIYWGYF